MMINKDERLIEQEEIEKMLNTQFIEIINSDPHFFGSLNLKIAFEQQYIREQKKDPNTIYIVYKLSPFTLDYGQAIMPITLVAISEHNNVNRCHRLLMDFSQAFNIDWDETNTMKQFWESPQDVGNFEEIYDGFRSTFYVSGALIVSKTANFVDLYSLSWKVKLNGNEVKDLINLGKFETKFYDFNNEKEKYQYTYSSSKWSENIDYCFNYVPDNLNDGDEIVLEPDWNVKINYLTFAEDTSIQPDSQVFQTTKNFVRSIGMSGTNTLSITTYLLDEDFCNKCLAIKIKDLDRQPDGVDTKFYFKLKFKNGYELKDVYKLISFSMSSQLKEIPGINVSFIN